MASGERAAVRKIFQVSRNRPAYYLTSVTHDRLPIFRSDAIKQVVANALDEARKSAGIMIFAYAIMPDHTQLITASRRETDEVLQYINGISAKRVIEYLKANGYESSLAKLRIQELDGNHKHSVYGHHPNAIRLTGETALFKKVQYVNLNPVRAELVHHPNDYLYSSARQWHSREMENEPLLTDHHEIKWRK